jgi:hypothetical protein
VIKPREEFSQKYIRRRKAIQKPEPPKLKNAGETEKANKNTSDCGNLGTEKKVVFFFKTRLRRKKTILFAFFSLDRKIPKPDNYFLTQIVFFLIWLDACSSF